MSDKSRRKLLKSIAAGSGAIVAGKSLPESWSKPVVDSVMLPAHAQTSDACSTINVITNIAATGALHGWNWSYAIYLASDLTGLDGDSGSADVNQTDSYTYGPGQYIVSGAFGGTTGTDGSISGSIQVACCSGDRTILLEETIPANTTTTYNSCALVTIGEDGTCTVVSISCP